MKTWVIIFKSKDKLHPDIRQMCA